MLTHKFGAMLDLCICVCVCKNMCVPDTLYCLLLHVEVSTMSVLSLSIIKMVLGGLQTPFLFVCLSVCLRSNVNTL